MKLQFQQLSRASLFFVSSQILFAAPRTHVCRPTKNTRIFCAGRSAHSFARGRESWEGAELHGASQIGQAGSVVLRPRAGGQRRKEPGCGACAGPQSIFGSLYIATMQSLSRGGLAAANPTPPPAVWVGVASTLLACETATRGPLLSAISPGALALAAPGSSAADHPLLLFCCRWPQHNTGSSRCSTTSRRSALSRSHPPRP